MPMSIVSDFARSMAAQAFPMIGEETVTIAGAAVPCVLAQVEDEKDFATGGFEVIKRLEAVARTADLPAGVLLKKLATAREQTFRIETIRTGATFTTLVLEQIEKS
jgi:hypothetical protein